MEAKSTITLVSAEKPSASTSPILRRRAKFASSIDLQISKVGSQREGNRVSRENFWLENGVLYCALRYGKQRIELQKGKSTLKAANWDDLVAQLDEIKTITLAGGLDEALSAAANSVRKNFAKDKKSAKA